MQLSDIRVNDLALVVRLRMDVGRTTPHKRIENGLIFAESGVLRFEHEGGSFDADRGHALLAPDRLDYSFTCIEAGTFYVINFTAVQPLSFRTFIRFDILSSQRILHKLERMYALWEFRKPAYMPICIGMVYEFLALMETGEERYVPKRKHELLAPAIAHIESHFDEPGIDIAMLARMCGISEIYFRKLFVQKYGISPIGYIRGKRMQKAKTLLEIGYSSIAEVAESVGYANVFSFGKAFKQVTGMSPGKYARSVDR